MATKSGPPGPLLVAIIGPLLDLVYFSWQKAVHPSEKWTGCSLRSLARLYGYKNITNDTFMTVLCHDGEFSHSHVRGHVHVTATDSLHYQ